MPTRNQSRVHRRRVNGTSRRIQKAGKVAISAFVEVALQVFLPREFVPYVQAITLVVIIVVLYFRPQGFARRIEERVA